MLKVENVSFTYRNRTNKSTVQVLENVSVDFEPGKFYSIYGPSGSGKTTLLALLGGLDKPDTGKITISGVDIKEIGYIDLRKRVVSYVFQNYYLFPYLTSIENVLIVMDDKNTTYKEKHEKAIQILTSLDIQPDEINRKVKRLSGGQQQRIAIARCLATGSDYILADEPTGNLDNNTSMKIIDLFTSLVKEYNKCVIVVTHSEMVKNSSDISYRICDKRIEQLTV